MNSIIYFLLETAKKEENDKWYIKIFKEIGKEIKDFAKDFKEFFKMIKSITYDALVEKFGYTGVTLLFAAIFVILIMIVITTVIRGKE